VFDPLYEAQAALLIRCLPEIGRQRCFALKGGTAINFFVRNLPRLSVDIDLTYLPLQPRDEALQGISDALTAIGDGIKHRISGAGVKESRIHNSIVKLFISTADALVKIEPNLVFRGSIHPPQALDLCQAAQDHFEAFASIQTLSPADLYGGKLCAALDRQHPRDLFDVKLLLEGEGITPQVRRAFVIYLAGHDRPMNELLSPRLKDIQQTYENSFGGMARSDVSLDELRQAQADLPRKLVGGLDRNEKDFLLSLKQGDPQWGLLGIGHLHRLPALQWKLINIRKMDRLKRLAALKRLTEVLGM
jgi:predicted nucleotidyltransferase component of viral defense system